MVIRRRPFACIFLAMLAILPSATAGWAAKGAYEPDTFQDMVDNMMWKEPDHAVNGYRVYLNGIQGTEVGVGASAGIAVNPNLAVARTAHGTYPQRAWAMLGVWKDCNRDSYVGLGDNALLEYRAELLSDRSLCPQGSRFHDGQWVHEFLPLSWPSRDPDGFMADYDANDLEDKGARVWADDGLPGAPIKSTSCYTFAPRGTYHSVGGIVDHVDCYEGSQVEPIGVRVGGEAWPEVRSTRNPWGEPSETPAFEIWDCGARPDAETPWPAHYTVYPVAPSVYTAVPPSPSATIARALYGLEDCQRAAPDDGVYVTPTAAEAPYALEGDHQDQVHFRAQSDFTLHYVEPRDGPAAVLLGRGTPEDGGYGGLSSSGGFWTSDTVRAISRNPYIHRGTLGPETVQVTTFYADVSAPAIVSYSLSLPNPAVRYYGAEACGTGITGIRGGWQCDAKKWYANNTMPRSLTLGGVPGDASSGVAIGVAPGWPYRLRDIDCIDESARTAREGGLSYGALTGTRCPSSPP